jgi:ABC-type uncharacterized transport system substrate-binding protein
VNASNPATNALQLRDAKAAAAAIPIKLIPVEVRASEDLNHALKAFEREQVAAVIVLGDTVFLAARRNIAQHALALRLPTIFAAREFVVDGGLISYGIDLQDSWHRASGFVHWHIPSICTSVASGAKRKLPDSRLPFRPARTLQQFGLSQMARAL